MRILLSLIPAMALAASLPAQTIVNSWQVDPIGAAFAGGVHYDCATDRCWVVDETNDLITEYDGAGTFIQQFAAPIPPGSGASGPLPIGVGVDPSTGMLWIGDEAEWVYELDPATGLPTGVSWPTSPAISDVSGVSVDPSTGHIYVSQDSGTQVVVEFDQAGAVINTINVSGVSGDPDGLAFNAATGTYYLGDDIGDTVYEVDSAGTLVNSWSMSGLGISPEGLGVDLENGLMYIGDGFVTRSVYVVSGIVAPTGSCPGGSSVQLSITGSCPGTITFNVSGGSGTYALIYGPAGTYTKPGGVCAGTTVDVNPPNLGAVMGGSLTANVPGGACGLTVQAVDLNTCDVSNSLVL